MTCSRIAFGRPFNCFVAKIVKILLIPSERKMNKNNHDLDHVYLRLAFYKPGAFAI